MKVLSLESWIELAAKRKLLLKMDDVNNLKVGESLLLAVGLEKIPKDLNGQYNAIDAEKYFRSHKRILKRLENGFMLNHKFYEKGEQLFYPNGVVEEKDEDCEGASDDEDSDHDNANADANAKSSKLDNDEDSDNDSDLDEDGHAIVDEDSGEEEEAAVYDNICGLAYFGPDGHVSMHWKHLTSMPLIKPSESDDEYEDDEIEYIETDSDED